MTPLSAALLLPLFPLVVGLLRVPFPVGIEDMLVADCVAESMSDALRFFPAMLNMRLLRMVDASLG